MTPSVASQCPDATPDGMLCRHGRVFICRLLVHGNCYAGHSASCHPGVPAPSADLWRRPASCKNSAGAAQHQSRHRGPPHWGMPRARSASRWPGALRQLPPSRAPTRLSQATAKCSMRPLPEDAFCSRGFRPGSFPFQKTRLWPASRERFWIRDCGPHRRGRASQRQRRALGVGAASVLCILAVHRHELRVRHEVFLVHCWWWLLLNIVIAVVTSNSVIRNP